MYRSFFGLRDRPFDLTPDPTYLLLTPIHREALAMLQYGLMARKGLIVLTGEAGTGKTTLLRTMHADASDDTLFVTVNNPRLDRNEFVETIAQGFCLPPRASTSKPRMLETLQNHLLARLADGQPSALVVDEAHALSGELLEEVRLLANLETDSAKLLTIVLAGQPELADRLNETAHWHLKQRVALRCTLRRLTVEETSSFIAWRIRKAGGQPAGVFTLEAVKNCHKLGCGIPRLISVICDNALIAAYAAGEKPVNAARVHEVCRDLDLIDLENRAPDLEVPVSAGGREPLSSEDASGPTVAESPEVEDTRAVDAAPLLFAQHVQPRRAWFFR